MAKEEINSSKIESKFKLSLLNMEKRFVDLESFVSEMSDKVKDLDLSQVSELKQKTEDVENLILVEQAGIIELKKMLENMPQPEAPKVDVAGLEAKISEIEQKVSATEKPDLQPIINQINELKNQIDEKIKEFASKVPNLDTEIFTSKYDTMQRGLNDILNKKAELDLKVEGVKKSIEIIDYKIGEMATENIAEEIQNNKKDIVLVGAKMETMERIIKNLNYDLQQIQLSMTKFDSFEKLTLLSKEIESKIERFKLIEDELRRLSARMEMLYTNIDKRIEGVVHSEKKIPEMIDSITEIRKNLDKQKIEVLDRIRKDEIKNVLKNLDESNAKYYKDLENKVNSLNSKIGKTASVAKQEFENYRMEFQGQIDSVKNLASGFNQEIEKIKKGETKIVKSLEERLNNLSSDVEKRHQEIMGRISDVDFKEAKELQNKYGELTNSINNLKVELQKINGRLSKEVVGVATDLQNSYNLMNAVHREIRGKMDVVQARDFVKKGDLQSIYKNMKELDNKQKMLDGKVKQVKTDEILQLMGVLKKDLDERLNALKEKEDSLVEEVVRHTEVGLDEMDYRMQTLLEKFVYLETRMAAIEKMMYDTRMQPLIIE